MLLIKNGYMIDPKSGREGKLDILTAGDRILRIGAGEVGAGFSSVDAVIVYQRRILLVEADGHVQGGCALHGLPRQLPVQKRDPVPMRRPRPIISP